MRDETHVMRDTCERSRVQDYNKCQKTRTVELSPSSMWQNRCSHLLG